MIDYDILNEAGTTNARIREFFTAVPPTAKQVEKLGATVEGRKELKRIRRDVADRKKFEVMISGWLQEHIIYSLENHRRYSAVDLMWDSVPISREIYPLIQYAQGRIDVSRAANALSAVPEGNSYIKKDDKGQVVGIDLPKFTSMNINLGRSVITRRVAAQSVKYANLDPHFRYEPRSLTQVGRLRGDLTSQRMDIMADQYDYKGFEEQRCRDMFLYTETVAFPRSSWERDVQWEKKDRNPALVGDVIEKQARIEREGICWVAPHRSRMFYDNAYPLSSLNTDTGCNYIGWWDVVRWGTVSKNPTYFNRKQVAYSADAVTWFTTYQTYFNQYFDKIQPPPMPGDPIGVNDPSIKNDRKVNIGVYTGQMEQAASFLTQLWVKVNPREWRWGNYPYPIWVHLKCAGDATVVYADIMPSSPAAVWAYNTNEGRLDNISMAHELMQFQDQLTNLYSQLLETIKTDLFAVAILNEDVFPDTEDGKKVLKEFKKVMSGNAYYTSMQMLTCSFEKLTQILGHQISADMVFKVVRATPNTAITQIFEAIARVIAMAEKMMVMSQHEQGQAASHEITASESNQIAGSTDTIYSFISGAIDRARAAMKRICFESLIACGSDQVELPVVNRYPDHIIEKAGFDVKDRDEDDPVGYVTVMGSKHSLVHDYMFTSRDGGNRPSNGQAAQVLVQLIQGIGSMHPSVQNAILSAMGKEKLFDLFNTIFRLADTGIDLKLQLKAGDDNSLMLEEDQQVMGAIQKMAMQLKQNTIDVSQLKQLAAQILQAGHGPAKESISINYKDAPPQIQRQMEKAAGFIPAADEPANSAQQLALENGMGDPGMMGQGMPQLESQ